MARHRVGEFELVEKGDSGGDSDCADGSADGGADGGDDTGDGCDSGGDGGFDVGCYCDADGGDDSGDGCDGGGDAGFDVCSDGGGDVIVYISAGCVNTHYFPGFVSLHFCFYHRASLHSSLHTSKCR